MSDEPVDAGDPPRAEMLGEMAGRLVRARLERVPTLPILPPDGQPDAEAPVDPWPEDGVPVERLLADADPLILGDAAHLAHPGFLAYIPNSPSRAAPWAHLLAGLSGANAASWHGGRRALELERTVLHWLADLVGYPGRDGLITSGGTTALLHAIAAAVHRADPERETDGVDPARRKLRLYTGAGTHFVVERCVRLLGLGATALRRVPSDVAGRVRADALADAVAEDAAAGWTPCAVVGTAGNTMTGAVDPLDALADIADAHDAAFVVDACFGGPVAGLPEHRDLFRGLARADAITLDPPKWLRTGTGYGIVLVKDPRPLAAAFGQRAEYIPDDIAVTEPAFTGLELSRAPRGIVVWTVLRHHGRRAIRESVRRDIALAHALRGEMDRRKGFHVLSREVLPAVCFRYTPPGVKGADADALQGRLIADLEKRGPVMPGPGEVEGRPVIRVCLTNHETTWAHLTAMLDAIETRAPTLMDG